MASVGTQYCYGRVQCLHWIRLRTPRPPKAPTEIRSTWLRACGCACFDLSCYPYYILYDCSYYLLYGRGAERSYYLLYGNGAELSYYLLYQYGNGADSAGWPGAARNRG